MGVRISTRPLVPSLLWGFFAPIVRNRREVVLVFMPAFLRRQSGDDIRTARWEEAGGAAAFASRLGADCVGLLPVSVDLYSTLGTNAVRRYGLIMERRSTQAR